MHLVAQQLFDLSGDLSGLADRDTDFKPPARQIYASIAQDKDLQETHTQSAGQMGISVGAGD